MKKNYLAMAILACGLLTFSACSNEDVLTEDGTTINAGEIRDVELSFDFSVNTGATRGGRPLYSSEALQQVNEMKVYVFKKSDTEYIYEKEITDDNNFGFNNEAAQGTESHSYTLTDKLTDGTYKFLAVGYEDGYATTFKSLTLSAQTTKLSEILLELNADQNADEVFSGVSGDVIVSSTSASFTVSVQLDRVVAGVLGYFKNVPYQIENSGEMKQVKHVLLTVVKKGISAKLEDRSAGSVADGGDRYTIIDIAMTGNQDGDNNWYKVDALVGTPATVENSVLSGAYSLPIAAVGSENTLEVELTDEEGTVLKTYPVQFADTDNKSFALEANHFYSLGQKYTDDDTNGGNPDPGTDPDDNDDPIDLSKDQIITITVNANWTAIHELELGE